MKSTGIVRKIDQLGRIVIPVEIRRNLELDYKESMEIFIEEDKILLKKFHENYTCMITGELSESNFVTNSGIVLSLEGARILIEELKNYLDEP